MRTNPKLALGSQMLTFENKFKSILLRAFFDEISYLFQILVKVLAFGGSPIIPF